MRRVQYLIFIFFLVLPALALHAQKKLSYKQLDSLSLVYVEKAKWAELETLGVKATEAGYDYFYLNLRVGLAKFKLGKYYEADKYYRKARRSNSNNEWLKENMFWNYIWLEDYWMADGTYGDFTEEEKMMLVYPTKDLFSFGYAEVGTKLSNLSDSANNMNYAALGAYHKFSPSFAIYHQLSFLTQELYDGSFNQYDYHFAPNYRINRSMRLMGRFNVAVNQFDLDFETGATYLDSAVTTSDRRFVDSTMFRELGGAINARTVYAQLGVNYTVGRWKITPAIGLFLDRVKNDYTEQKNTIVVNNYQVLSVPPIPPTPPVVTVTETDSTLAREESTNSSQIQLSTGVSYVLPVLQDKIRLGCNLYYLNGSEEAFTVSPNIEYELSEKIELKASYLNVGTYFFAENGSTVLYNTTDLERQKISISGSYQFENNWKVYLTLQNEKITDNLRSIDYHTNNLFLGLKF